jgi:hypothetical protein
MRDLKEQGSLVESKVSPRNAFNLCGLQKAIDFDIDAGGVMYSKGV